MKENINSDIKLYEHVEFILDNMLANLKIGPLQEKITIFPALAWKKWDWKLIELAEKCAIYVVVTESNCCGFVGDRDFSFPELNERGLRNFYG